MHPGESQLHLRLHARYPQQSAPRRLPGQGSPAVRSCPPPARRAPPAPGSPRPERPPGAHRARDTLRVGPSARSGPAVPRFINGPRATCAMGTWHRPFGENHSFRTGRGAWDAHVHAGSRTTATSVLRGRPRERLTGTIAPRISSSPPHTPHASLRSSAPARHAILALHPRHISFARSTSCGDSEKNSSGLPCEG
jgi:hypothetical protein